MSKRGDIMAASMSDRFSSVSQAYCLSRRSTVILTIIFSFIVILFLASFGTGVSFPNVSDLSFIGGSQPGLANSNYSGPIEGSCLEYHRSADLDLWEEARTKYTDLMDDKFTVAIQTYRRPAELNSTIHLLTDNHIPSLHEIVVVWNDLEEEPPADFVSANGVGVRYRVSRKNSLNEKLWPDPDFKTQAVLLSDDDVHYHPKDLDWVFQTWRKQGRDRLTGAFARCVVKKDDGSWAYSFCRDGEEGYALILTGLAMVDVSFLHYYSSEDPVMKKVRDLVDDRFNCEDIALNFVFTMLTCNGPLQLRGAEKAVNTMPPAGISTKPGHLEARHKCMNDFVSYFGHMPLINSTSYVAKGWLNG